MYTAQDHTWFYRLKKKPNTPLPPNIPLQTKKKRGGGTQTNTKQYLQSASKSFAMCSPVSKYCQFKDRKRAKELAEFLCYEHTPQSRLLLLSPCGWKKWTFQKHSLWHGRALQTRGNIENKCVNMGANYRTAEKQHTVQASDNHGLEDWKKRGLRLLAGPHIFRKYYSIEFSQVIIFKYFSHYSDGFISLFPPKSFVLTVFSIEMSLYFFVLLLFVSLILVAEIEIKTPICKHLWRIHPKQKH